MKYAADFGNAKEALVTASISMNAAGAAAGNLSPVIEKFAIHWSDLKRNKTDRYLERYKRRGLRMKRGR